MRSGIVLVLLAATGLGSQNIKEHQEPQGCQVLPALFCQCCGDQSCFGKGTTCTPPLRFSQQRLQLCTISYSILAIAMSESYLLSGLWISYECRNDGSPRPHQDYGP